MTNPAPTERQGRFLAYIHQYGTLNGCAPSEADMQRYFQVTPPSVHTMVLTTGRERRAASVVYAGPPHSKTLGPWRRMRASGE